MRGWWLGGTIHQLCWTTFLIFPLFIMHKFVVDCMSNIIFICFNIQILNCPGFGRARDSREGFLNLIFSFEGGKCWQNSGFTFN